MRTGELVEAFPMTQMEHERIKAQVEGMLGHEITLQTRVDPTLIGGFVVTVEDMVLDYSMASQLKQIRQRLET